MHWMDKAQRYGCTCGEVLYEGGEGRSRVQHRLHKAGQPTTQQMQDALQEIANPIDFGTDAKDNVMRHGFFAKDLARKVLGPLWNRGADA